MVVPIALMMVAGLLLYAGTHKMTVGDVLRVALGRKPIGNSGGLIDIGSGDKGGTTGANVTSTRLGNTTNPVPGATGGRLDQGMDGTGRDFLAPFDGTVEIADQSNAGWAGGGYVAVRSDHDPNVVYYLAEGISPTISKGQKVTAGDRLAIPVNNPYNGITGNYENGWADPNDPGRPLAQAVSNPATEVLQFYQWLRSLGGPKATSTSNAGNP